MKLNTQQGVERRASSVESHNPVLLSTLATRPSAFGSQRGIALVITLILLSVTLVMAIAFLAISRRERGSVVTETDTVMARLAADSGLANAEAQILATVLQTTNPYNFNLLVSTNYINPAGFLTTPATTYTNPTNVSYIYPNGNPLTPDDFKQNVANLWFLPRAPVFAYDRTTGSNEFRFYLDLNRNRQFDANGLVPMIGQNGGFLHPDGSEDNSAINVVTNSMLGDPEWIGVLERPDAPHGPNNKFLSRYAFFALPSGNTLDLNAIHNEVFNQGLGTADGFFRNQGVGTWEINLAAFLADLNTNIWGQNIGAAGYYQYNEGNLPAGVNSGRAFDDARALLAYRYSFNYNTLVTFSSLFPFYPSGGGAVDMFPFGNNPPMTTTAVPFYNYGLNVLWPGANNTNHYFALTSDLFDPTKTQNGIGAFIDRLQFASTNIPTSTYNRYTFYRLLSQLGTDSEPESDKLNVNYVNVDNQGNIVPNLQTNTVAWEPAQFFTNAADRMLRAYTAQWFQASPSNYLATYYNIHTNYFYTDISGNVLTNDPAGLGLTNVLGLPNVLGLTRDGIPTFGVTNIPVWVNDKFVYTPAVQRILQLAANIHDATTNRSYDGSGFPLPTLFQPIFQTNLLGIFIGNFREYTLPGLNLIATLPLNLADDVDRAKLQPFSLAYGVPIIIGAKKNLPNFNEFEMTSTFSIQRKLQFTRATVQTLGADQKINQMYTLSIKNQLGVECWNSYGSNYTRQTEMAVVDQLQLALTNDESTVYAPTFPLFSTGLIPINNWQGIGSAAAPNPTSFKVPFYTNAVFLPEVVYTFHDRWFAATNATYESNVVVNGSIYPQPHWGLATTNNLQAILIDTLTGRAIDYVQLSGPTYRRDLIEEIRDPNSTPLYPGLWATNDSGSGIPWGIVNQREVSLGKGFGTAVGDYGRWESGIAGSEIASFMSFYLGGKRSFTANGTKYVTNNLELSVQVPFTAARISLYYTAWQANDPLVHYLASDLNYSGMDSGISAGTNNRISLSSTNIPQLTSLNLGILNDRYQPWKGNPNHDVNSSTPDDFYTATAYNMALKDPYVSRSDNWSFPTNKFPTVGWLGRVHRGTPWQTVYLKASGVNTNFWRLWTGNVNSYDAVNMVPSKDRLLFDIFSTALNDNATRGQLPINVGAGDTNNPAAGLAAWSAVFSGIVVPTNRVSGYVVIDPAGVNGTNSPLGQIVANINSTRAQFVSSNGVVGAFEHVGDILRTPLLTEQSPFLKPFFNSSATNNLTDALYEWLPQQTMSLLRMSSQPRFVIYSYGQTLTPAPNGVVTSGGQAGMVTNYQVTAETVTRTVLRVEGAPTNTHAVVESYNILPPD